MKIRTIVLLILCSFVAVQAQPVLTTAQLPQNGDSVIRYLLSPNNFTTGPSGANVTWDYSSCVVTADHDLGTMQQAIPLNPGTWNYNQAYVFRRTINGNTSGNDYFDYYLNTPDSLSRAGMDYSIPDLHPFENHNAAPLLRFPMTYGDNFTETFGGVHQSIAGPYAFTGISYVTADAYGTLIGPDSTYANVLRVHVVDSINEGAGTFLFSGCYYYYSPLRRYPLLIHCNEDLTEPYIWYEKSNSLVLARDVESNLQVRIYPNPVRGTLQIDLAGLRNAASLVLVNTLGQVMLRREVRGSETITVRDLEAGVYFVEVACADGRKYQKKVLVLR